MPSTDPTAPAGRPNGSRSPRAGLPMLIALLSVTALAAGIVTRMFPSLPTRQAVGPGERLLEEVIVDEFAIKAEAKALEHVVLQLDLQRDCPWPDCTVPWGHVPTFTLFDDGQVVYTGTGDFPRYLVQRGMALPEEWTPLLQQVSALIDASMSPLSRLSPTTPCPASGGCRGADVIVRIRREGRLETYAASEGSDPVTVDAFEAIVERIQGWPPPIDRQVFTPNMETVWDVTGGAADAYAYPAPPPPYNDMSYFSETQLPSEQFPVMVEMGRGTQLHDFDANARGVDDGTDADTFPSAYDNGVPEAYWYRPEGHWLMRPVFDRGGVPIAKEPMKLAVVPWIYPSANVDAGMGDVEVQMDVEAYAEALLNAAVARAVHDATADALLFPIPDETAVPETNGTDVLSQQIVPPSPTPFPTAAFVQWSNDGRPTLPTARGIQTWMQWYRYDEDRAALIRLRQAGFEWFKQRFAWADMQPTGSQGMDTAHSDLYIQTVNDLGGRVMIQLAVPPAWAVDAGSDDPFNLIVWERFVGAFALRYSGQVDAYEIMNEPNLAREWGAAPDPAAYARVLKVAYDAIKSADSNAVVISAGLAPTGDRMPEAMGDVTFLRELIEDMDGTIDGYLDAIGVHAAGFKAAPAVSPDEAAASPELGGDRTFTFRRIEDLRALMMERSRAYAPLVITEFGWTVDPRPASPYHWAAIDPIERGKFIATVFEQNTALFENDMWLGGPMILFSAADRAWTADDEAFWWAVADADGNVDGAVREALGLDVPSEGEDD